MINLKQKQRPEYNRTLHCGPLCVSLMAHDNEYVLLENSKGRQILWSVNRRVGNRHKRWAISKDEGSGQPYRSNYYRRLALKGSLEGGQSNY